MTSIPCNWKRVYDTFLFSIDWFHILTSTYGTGQNSRTSMSIFQVLEELVISKVDSLFLKLDR